MDFSFMRGSHSNGKKPEEKTNEESPKKSFFQRSLTDNTLKFFGSVSEKKNGLWSNFSSKLDSVVHVPSPKKQEENRRTTPEGSSPEKNSRRMSQPTLSQTDKQYASSPMSQSVILNGHINAPQTRPDLSEKSGKKNVKVDVHADPGKPKDELAGRVKVTPDVQINFDTPLYEKSTSSGDSSMSSSPRKPTLQRRDSLTAEEVFLDNLEKRKGLLVVDNSEVVANLASPNRTMREFQFTADDNDDELFLVPVPSDQNLMDFDKADIGMYESIKDESDGQYNGRERYDSDSSSEGECEYGGTVLGSRESLQSLVGEMDEESAACRDFMVRFVDAVFAHSPISQNEKANFGQYCQESSGRLWFARSINSKRVESKSVDEEVFYQLVQYFALVLFECNDADDFSPAKTLMNMCFTFYHETKNASGITCKNFLYSYLKDQLIWRSLRFWNAAFFDAVQCERSRRPVSTNKDDTSAKIDDRTFQENVIFGQLGTFACNMRAFGLGKDLCLEFIRKQSVIGNLKEEQVKMLRENIERWTE